MRSLRPHSARLKATLAFLAMGILLLAGTTAGQAADTDGGGLGNAIEAGIAADARRADGRKTATVVASGYSFNLSAALTTSGARLLLTTYTPDTGFPLSDCDAETCTYSNEVEPVALGSLEYRADYVADEASGFFEYGTLSLTLSSTDANGNQIPDALEIGLEGSFGVTGTATSDYNAYGYTGEVSTMTMSVNRSAGKTVGTYNGSYRNILVTANFSGEFRLSGGIGTCEYELGGDLLTFSLVQENGTTTEAHYEGTSEIIREDSSAIQLTAFALIDQMSGHTVITHDAKLTRDGAVYRGILEVEDGHPSSWADYRYYLVEITDANDFNSDGIPDLSYAPEPTSVLLQLTALLTLAGLRRRTH